jgi:DNA-binding CsgD family transcriptional regulator
MLKESDIKILSQFLGDLYDLVNSCDTNVDFRQNALALIKKDFAFHRMSFNYFEQPIRKGDDWKLPIFNNVTYGISREIMTEYYNKFYRLDIFKDASKERDYKKIVRICDVISYEQFEKTEFYQQYYKKHGLYYQIGMSLCRDGDVIGTFAIFRGQSEGDFSDQEIELLEHIQLHLSRALALFMNKEHLHQELQHTRNLIDHFPTGHLVLNDQFQVIYSNPMGEAYVTEMTGSHINEFKYFFINNIVPNISKHIQSEHLDTLIDLDRYYLRVTKYQNMNASDFQARQNHLSVYIQKKMTSNEAGGTNLDILALMSGRELEVIDLVRRGYKNIEIAKVLGLSAFTVKAHLQRIYDKVGVNSKTTLLYKISLSKE